MIFKGISKEFSLLNENQYNTIGDFWDEMALLYGLKNLQGLGYKWADNKIFYAIGLKDGDIKGYNLRKLISFYLLFAGVGKSLLLCLQNSREYDKLGAR